MKETKMKTEDLKDRTKAIALRVLKLVDALPNSVSGRTIADQIARSGTSVAANDQAACRAKSTADFISKMDLQKEADELVAITVSSINTARRNRSTPAIRNPKSELES